MDEVGDLDPELREIHTLWLEGRERHLGHLSNVSFDLASAPPGVAATATAEVSAGTVEARAPTVRPPVSWAFRIDDTAQSNISVRQF